MNSQRTLKMIAVIAAVCLFQISVLAAVTTPNASSTANGLMLGRLMLAGSESILVNGNSAGSGTTILSGSQLQTPAQVEATVQLGSAGKLFIQPNTNLTVTFDKTNINVKVVAGKAFVAANPGVASSVTNPDGTTAAGEPEALPAPAPAPLTHNQKIAIGFVVVAGVLIPVIYFATNGS